jgi:hypothetical protein
MRFGGCVIVFAAIAAACSSFDAAPVPREAGSGDASIDLDASGVHPYVAAVLEDNPTFYFRLEESGGATPVNSVQGPFAGGYEGIVRLGAEGAFAGSRAMDHDDANGGLSVPTPDISGLKHFSIELWYRQRFADVADAGDKLRFLAARSEGRDNQREGVYLFVEPTVGLSFERLVSGSAPRGVYVSPPPRVAMFHHVVATFDGTMLRLFVDGANVASTPDDRAANPSGRPFLFGDFGQDRPYTTFLPFIGTIDEIAFYAEALDPARVDAHFRAAKGR